MLANGSGRSGDSTRLKAEHLERRCRRQCLPAMFDVTLTELLMLQA